MRTTIALLAVLGLAAGARASDCGCCGSARPIADNQMPNNPNGTAIMSDDSRRFSAESNSGGPFYYLDPETRQFVEVREWERTHGGGEFRGDRREGEVRTDRTPRDVSAERMERERNPSQNQNRENVENRNRPADQLDSRTSGNLNTNQNNLNRENRNEKSETENSNRPVNQNENKTSNPGNINNNTSIPQSHPATEAPKTEAPKTEAPKTEAPATTPKTDNENK